MAALAALVAFLISEILVENFVHLCPLESESSWDRLSSASGALHVSCR